MPVRPLEMAPLDWIAAVVLALQGPIPVFWLLFHPLLGFWRRHGKLGFLVAGLIAWGGVASLLVTFRDILFASRTAPAWAITLGLALLLLDALLFYRVEREMGSRRLVGLAELAGTGELATSGLYARIRHPRYTGMMLAVLGACLISATLTLWLAALVWWVLALFAVQLEERELRGRFGSVYERYARRVPRFLPFRLFPPKDDSVSGEK